MIPRMSHPNPQILRRGLSFRNLKLRWESRWENIYELPGQKAAKESNTCNELIIWGWQTKQA